MTRAHPSVLISSSLKSVEVPERQSEHTPPVSPTGYLIDGNSYDYTKGKLGVLVDIIIESGAKLFGKTCLYLHHAHCSPWS